MMFAYLIKARPKAGKPNLFTWFDSKSDSRADREIMNILEDNEIETGRGADYMLPVRTNVPVLDDLPEENALDETWCDRYELADDNRTWKKIVAAEPAAPEKAPEAPVIETQPEPEALSKSTPADKDLVVDVNDDDLTEYPVAEMAFNRRLLAQFTSDEVRHHITQKEHEEIAALEMDTDNGYVQNLLLAAENCVEIKSYDTKDLWRYTDAIRKVFSKDKRHELTLVLRFTRIWAVTDYIDRGILTHKWASNRISNMQRTESGATAGGGNKTDRNPEMVRSLDTLDIEIALALLPFDFNIYDFEQAILRRAKEMVAGKESPWKDWSRKLRNCPAILDYSRAAIFAVIRSAAPDIHMMPGTHQAWINAKLTETDHANPSAETLALAMRSTVLNSTTESSTDAGSEQAQDDVTNTSVQPEIKRISSTVFSIEGLMGSQNNDNPVINIDSNEVENVETNQPSIDDVNKQLAAARGEFVEGISDPNDPKWVHEELSKATSNEVEKQEIKPEENTSDEQVETTDSNQVAGSTEIPAGEGVDADGEEVAAIEQPAAEFPAYFEPGRYEGLPNEVYHGANGISSTQVKDARVSLMYFQGRHITKTIGRETSDALTFGTLVHALALEPETLETDFAVYPGLPSGAFTTTDTMKAFIREYNEGKDKAEQLKMTGTKDVLATFIRAVNPDAIFADEFEQQWREANQDKIILNDRQLAHAQAIQAALFSHPSAGQLLQHPNRANEVSYFGMDEETGLEVRVRPDLEIDMTGVRIGVDLKTISLGKVKQDFLRAKLHREIIERDYHLSAAMYCDVADFNQFFWIFVNKDEGYHWVAIIEASEELLELGRLEYRKAMNAISNALDSNVWPAPITDDYTDELNDFDLRRLETLRLA